MNVQIRVTLNWISAKMGELAFSRLLWSLFCLVFLYIHPFAPHPCWRSVWSNIFYRASPSVWNYFPIFWWKWRFYWKQKQLSFGLVQLYYQRLVLTKREACNSPTDCRSQPDVRAWSSRMWLGSPSRALFLSPRNTHAMRCNRRWEAIGIFHDADGLSIMPTPKPQITNANILYFYRIIQRKHN